MQKPRQRQQAARRGGRATVGRRRISPRQGARWGTYTFKRAKMMHLCKKGEFITLVHTITPHKRRAFFLCFMMLMIRGGFFFFSFFPSLVVVSHMYPFIRSGARKPQWLRMAKRLSLTRYAHMQRVHPFIHSFAHLYKCARQYARY